jgi:preprotein translocase subunit SecY
MGTFLPIPGINHKAVAVYLQNHSITRNLVSTFAGNDTFVIGLFTLNIYPSINASILIQVMTAFSTKLLRLQKEGDLEGKRSINRLTRSITLVFSILQSVSLAFYLKPILLDDWSYELAFDIVLWLTTGAMIILWFSELITDYGLGNGVSVLIYINIVSNLPNLTKQIIRENAENLSISTQLGIGLLIFLSLYGIVYLQGGTRVIPLLSSKQLNQDYRDSDFEPSRYYLPLTLNQAGVMPIILTTTLFVIPTYLSNSGFLPTLDLPFNLDSFQFIFKSIYWAGFFGSIIVFSSYYAKIVLNPKNISDDLQKMAVTIPGIRPGIQTAFYLKQVMQRVTLIGAILLATLVTLPNFIESTLNIPSLNALSTTSLLIVYGVVLDLARQIEYIYYSTIYNNQ